MVVLRIVWSYILSWVPKALFSRVAGLWLHPLAKWVAAGGTGILVALTVYLKGRKSGKKYTEVKRAKELKKNVKYRNHMYFPYIINNIGYIDY